MSARPEEGAIVYRRGSDLRGYYISTRDVVHVSTDNGPLELPWTDGDWELTRDRKLTEMEVAAIKWATLSQYRRSMGRVMPEWTMLRDSQRIAFKDNGDKMTGGEAALMAAISKVLA